MELYLTLDMVYPKILFLGIGIALTMLLYWLTNIVDEHISPIVSLTEKESAVALVAVLFPIATILSIVLYTLDDNRYRTLFILQCVAIFLSILLYIYFLYRVCRARVEILLHSYHEYVLVSRNVPVMFRTLYGWDRNFLLDFGETLYHIFRGIPEIIVGDICWCTPVYSPQYVQLFRLGVKVDPEYITKNRMHKKEWNEAYFNKIVTHIVDILLKEFVEELHNAGREPLLTTTVNLNVQEISKTVIFAQNEMLIEEYSRYLQKHILESLEFIKHANFTILQLGD